MLENIIFDWFEHHIKLINEATELLNISKGLQQSLCVAEVLTKKFYKLQNISRTRFAYFLVVKLSLLFDVK